MEATSASTVRVLIAAQATSAVGDGSFYVTSALFLTRVVGLSPSQTGLWLTMAWGAGFVVSAPLGRLADVVGLRRSAVGLSVSVAVALTLATQVRGHLAFLVVLTGYAIAQSGLVGVRQAIVSVAVPSERRVAVRAKLQVIVNAGIGAGALMGGIALTIGTAHAYVAVVSVDALGFAVAAVLAARIPLSQERSPIEREPATTRSRGVLRDAPYLAAAAVSSVLYLYMPMLSVVVPLFLAEHTNAPIWTAAAVFVTNTGGVIALQVRAARTVVSIRTAAVSARRGGIVLGLACLVFALAALPAEPALAAGVVVVGAATQVVGEVLLGAGSWHIGFALADDTRPAEWQALYSSGLPLARTIGPLALSALILSWSGPGWIALALIFAGAGIALQPIALWGERRRMTPGRTTAAACLVLA